MSNVTIEERLSALEAEVQRMKQERNAPAPPSDVPWWRRIVGVYKEDSEFLEAMRLGREYRESLRPHDESVTS